MRTVVIMPGLKIWKGCEYVRVTQGSEYAWIGPNISYKCPNMGSYALIMLNMFKYAWIYLNNQSSEYFRLLNVSDEGHLKLQWFLRKPKWVLLHDSQNPIWKLSLVIYRV